MTNKILDLNKGYLKMLVNADTDDLKSSEDFFCELHDDKRIYIGVDVHRLPVVLIPAQKKTNIKSKKSYKGIDLIKNANCKIVNLKKNDNFHIIKYVDKEKNYETVKSFLDFLSEYFHTNNEIDISHLDKRLKFLSDLLSYKDELPKKTAMGLWSELFLIYISEDIDESINAWHENLNDLIDFKFKNLLIEVKSYSGTNRIHSFSLDQLDNFYDELYIASIQLKENDNLKSIKDLYEYILKKCLDLDLKDKFLMIIFKLAGNMDLDNYSYSTSAALKSLKFFKSKDIPSIKKENIPIELSRIKFFSNCEKVKNQKNILNISSNHI